MLGDNIKKIMKIKRITSKELADIVDVTPTHISYIINNKRDPSMELLSKVAHALDVSVNEFFDEENSQIVKEKTDKYSYNLSVIPEKFTNPNEARAYIGRHKIFTNEGINTNILNDNEVLNFANALLEQMKLVAYKYKK
ncbi:helix-turn-helix domain-containing protein [Clostridium tetani]|nr:helix-turn-helix transcriptional regulator [Clostridium tetani]